jgi:hypothetical protein
MVTAVGGAGLAVFVSALTMTTGVGGSVGVDGTAGSSWTAGGITVVTSTGIIFELWSGWQLTPANVKQNAQNKTNPGRFLSIGISLSIVSRYYTGMG